MNLYCEGLRKYNWQRQPKNGILIICKVDNPRFEVARFAAGILHQCIGLWEGTLKGTFLNDGVFFRLYAENNRQQDKVHRPINWERSEHELMKLEEYIQALEAKLPLTRTWKEFSGGFRFYWALPSGEII